MNFVCRSTYWILESRARLRTTWESWRLRERPPNSKAPSNSLRWTVICSENSATRTTVRVGSINSSISSIFRLVIGKGYWTEIVICSCPKIMNEYPRKSSSKVVRMIRLQGLPWRRLSDKDEVLRAKEESRNLKKVHRIFVDSPIDG